MELAATTSSTMRPERLPPTERAAFQHSLRVHLQVMTWKRLNVSQMEPCEWGWMVEKGRMTPFMTDIEPAPDDLLKYVRCKCKASSRIPCSTNLCSCQKSGLNCVTACRDCRGEECQNAAPVHTEEDEILEDANNIETLFLIFFSERINTYLENHIRYPLLIHN